MKLITLNLWGGRIYGELSKFLKAKKNTVDIFCFQEVLSAKSVPTDEAMEIKRIYQKNEPDEVRDLYQRIKGILIGFNSFISKPYSEGSERLAMFIRSGLEADVKSISVHKQISVPYDGKYYSVGSSMQYAKVHYNGYLYLIANIHGLWQGGGKGDTPERIEQSKNILKIMSRFGDRRILCGDFNLDISTESVHMLENEMKNLVRESKVSSTRGPLAPTSKGKFADYIFTSPSIKVKEFKVLKDIVSDHLPLYIDFE